MVDPEVNLPVNPDGSQSLFETHQTILQAPPEELKRNKQRSNRAIIAILIALLLIIGSAFASAMIPRRRQTVVQKPSPEPSVMPQQKMTEKESELKRVEAIVNQADPEKLLIMPPQVDMEVSF